MLEPSSQAAGLALKTASTHAFWIVDRREGIAIGSCRSTFAMFAWPRPADSTLTLRAAPLALLACAPVPAVSLGLNGSFAQLATWNGEDTDSLALPTLLSDPVMAIWLQLVGLNSNPGRSTATLICLSCTGTPLTNVGNGSLTIVTAAVVGSTSMRERTST